MAAVSLEVAALFAVEDQATPTLLRISELVDQITESARTAAAALADLGKLGADSLLRLGEQIGILDADLRGIGEAAGASAAEMDTAANTSVAALRRIQDEAFAARDAVASVGNVGAAEEEGALVGGALAARRGAGTREGGGPTLMSLFPKELVAPFALYEGMRQAGSEQDSLTATSLALHLDPRSKEGQAAIEQLRTAAEHAAMGTTFSEKQVAGGMEVLARPLGLTGQEGLGQFLNVFEAAAKAAEASERLHLGKYEDTLAGIVEFAHETGSYDAASLQPRIEQLGAITQQVPHSTMAAEARVMSYALPIARTLGIPEEEAMERVGFLQRAGLRGTVAATTLRQEWMGLLRSGGPLGAQLLHVQNPQSELSRELQLEPEERQATLKRARGSAHERAMHEAGLLDAQGHETFLTEGKIDQHKVDDILARYAATHTQFEQGKIAYELFGVRGQAANELFQISRDQSAKFHQTIATTMPLNEQQKRLAETPSGTAEQVVSRLGDILNESMAGPLKQLTPVMQGLVTAEQGLLGFLQSHKDVSSALGFGELAGGTVLAAGLAAKVASWISGIFSAGAVTEAATQGAARALPLALGGVITAALSSPILAAAAAAAAATAISFAISKLGPPIADYLGKHLGHPQPGAVDPHNPLSPPLTAPPAHDLFRPPGAPTAPAAPPTAQKQSLLVPANKNVMIQNVSVTVNGSTHDTTDGLVKRIHSELAMGINRALSHSSGVGAGSYDSMYQTVGDV